MLIYFGIFFFVFGVESIGVCGCVDVLSIVCERMSDKEALVLELLSVIIRQRCMAEIDNVFIFYDILVFFLVCC